MEPALIILWGAALLVIVVLLITVTLTTRRRAEPEPAQPAIAASVDEPSTDLLLFYHEEENVRAAFQGRVIVHIAKAAWEPDWQGDLLRVEVKSEDPQAVELPQEWEDPEVLSVYSLSAYRMTEIGNDVPVERFADPIDVILTTDERTRGALRCGFRAEEGWSLPPKVSDPAAHGVDVSDKPGWAAALIDRPGQVCLFRLAP